MGAFSSKCSPRGLAGPASDMLANCAVGIEDMSERWLWGRVLVEEITEFEAKLGVAVVVCKVRRRLLGLGYFQLPPSSSQQDLQIISPRCNAQIGSISC